MSLTLKVLLTPLLLVQALQTRRRLPRLPEADGPRQGTVGQGRPISIVIAGDSSAAGVGVVHQRKALAGQLSEYLAEAAGVCVSWRLLARTGLNTAQTLELLRREAPLLPQPLADIVIVVSGVNDVIDQVPSHRAVSAREAIANWLRNAQGVQHVVFAPLPPIQHLPGVPQPLRWVSGTDARRHNAALRRWVKTRGDVSSVEMSLTLNRGVLAEDGFHPGEPLYRYCATAIADHIARQVLPQIQTTGLQAAPTPETSA
jgi:lysophospholipase L1-like esterase